MKPRYYMALIQGSIMALIFVIFDLSVFKKIDTSATGLSLDAFFILLNATIGYFRGKRMEELRAAKQSASEEP